MRPSAHTLVGIVVGALFLALWLQLGRLDAEADAAFARHRNCEVAQVDCRSTR